MVNKFQQGGQPQSLEQQVVQLVQAAMQGDAQAQQQIQQIVQAAKQGDQQAMQIAQLIQATMQQMQQSARQGAKLNYLKKINGICPEGTQPTYYKVGGQICTKCEAMSKGGSAPQNKNNTKPKIQKNINPNDTIHTKFGVRDLTPNGKTGYPKLTNEEYNKLGYRQADVDTKDKNAGRSANNGHKNGGTIKEKACPKCGKVHAGKCGSKLMKKKKKCACGTKIDPKKGACGTKLKKTKKHEMGGVLEVIQKLQEGNKITKRMFNRQQQNYPGNHSVVAEHFIYGYGPRGVTYDFDPSVGRNIYISPHGNDTIYFNYPDDYVRYSNGYMPIGTTRNQEAAKQKFLNEVNRSTPYTKEDNAAYRRAKQEAVKKRQNGGSLNGTPFRAQ